jgi:signal transduction histidine kinase
MDTKEKPDLLKKMSSVVSHDLRNPLAIISNSLYFIKTKLGAGGAALDPKLAKHIGIIESEVKHSNEIIEEMLAFTRKRDLQLVPLSLGAIVEELTGSYPAPAGVTIKVPDGSSNPRVNADKDAISYALRGVLANAAQALPEGGTITVSCAQGDKTASVTISDGGPGFPNGDGEQAFEPFFTTKPRGLGLGLTIARKFFEQHGGSARAENAPGGGAKVTLSLPLLK